MMKVEATDKVSELAELFPGDYVPYVCGSFSGLESENLIIGECHTHTAQTEHLEDEIERIYLEMLSLISARGKSNLWRCWNRVPDINGQERGTERYQLFCTGRYRALLETGAIQDTNLPAATAVGADTPVTSLVFIAAKTKGKSIENPNQVSAYRYPEQYGKDSPSFSRAYLVNNILLVSGTASIRGHQSLYESDLQAQIDESLQRISELTQERTVNSTTAYVRHAGDVETVKAALRKAYPEAFEIHCEKADICRKELLVEIEVTAQ